MIASRSAPPRRADGRSRRSIRRSTTRCCATSRRVNRWTLAARPTLAFLDRAARGHARLPPARRRLRPWRHAAPDRALGAAARHRRRPGRRRPQPEQRGGRARGRRRSRCRSTIAPATIAMCRAVRLRHLQPRRPSYDRRAARAFLRFMEAQATGLVGQRSPPPRFRLSGFPLLARLLGTHRIVREDGQLSIARSFRAARMAGDPGRGRHYRGRGGSSAASPSGCASNGCADRRRRAGRLGRGDRAGPRRRDAVLIERTRGERDVVCGGFLGWDALAGLAGSGSIPPRSAPGRSTGCGWSRATASKRICRRPAAGLSRRRLDAARSPLPERSGRGGAARPGGARARGGPLRLDDGEEIAADALFLATGKHELRGAARPIERTARAAVAGLRAALPPRPDARRWPGRSNCISSTAAMPACCSRRTGAPISACRSRGRGWPAGGPEACSPSWSPKRRSLAERLGGGVPASWEAIAGVPYGWRARATRAGPVPGRRPGGGDRLPRRRRHRDRAGQRRGGGPSLPARRRRRPAAYQAPSRARAARPVPSPRRCATWRSVPARAALMMRPGGLSPGLAATRRLG